MTSIISECYTPYAEETEGVAELSAPFEIHVYSTKCHEAAGCLSCPLKSKFQFVLPGLPYSRKRRYEYEECLTFLDKGTGNEKFRSATSDLLEKMKHLHEQQIIQAKQEAATLNLLFQTQKSVHEIELGRLITEIRALKFENSTLTSSLEESHRRLRFLKTMELNVKSRSSKSQTTVDTSFLDGAGTMAMERACTMAVERARRYLAAGILKNPSLWVRRREADTEKSDLNSSPLIRAVINYCYTNDISFTEKATPEKALKIAHLYGLEQLKGRCEQELCTRITSDNLWEMFSLSRSFKAKDLGDEVLKYLEANAHQGRTTLDGIDTRLAQSMM